MTTGYLINTVPETDIHGDSEEDARLLRDMARKAKIYMNSHPWCVSVRECRYGIGIGGIIAVFACNLETIDIESDEWVWVVTGDIPPAFFRTDRLNNPAKALNRYIVDMRDWVHAVRSDKQTENLIPVNAPPTRENADDLGVRLNFIENRLLAYHRADLNE